MDLGQYSMDGSLEQEYRVKHDSHENVRQSSEGNLVFHFGC